MTTKNSLSEKVILIKDKPFYPEEDLKTSLKTLLKEIPWAVKTGKQYRDLAEIVKSVFGDRLVEGVGG